MGEAVLHQDALRLLKNIFRKSVCGGGGGGRAVSFGGSPVVKEEI